MLKFLGVGNSGTMKDFQSNLLFKNNKIMLIDCGTDIRFSLNREGISILDVNSIYISHLHADHMGGLEWVIFNTYFRNHKIDLILSECMVAKLWESLKAGVSCIEGKKVDLNTFFNVKPIIENKFIFDDIEFETVKCKHVVNDKEIVPSYGLYWKFDDKKYFLTTDCVITENLFPFYEKSDIIFHDCETGFKTGVHAHYDDLKLLPERVKEKMILYHCGDGNKPDCKKDSFNEYATSGKNYHF